MNADYRQGLLDAVTEIEAELECIELEYADSPPSKNVAFRALSNSKQLILDRLEIESEGMMSADRELLEKAAKAAGIAVLWPVTREGTSPRAMLQSSISNTMPTFWSPLTDDGDALRLAVKLKIEIHPGERNCVACHLPQGIRILELGPDVGVATRRAIVRTAALLERK